MSTIDPNARVSGRMMGPQADFGQSGGTGEGWLLFAAIILAIVGVLNVIYGIAAIGDSSFFVADTKFILSGLNTWGWVTLILGCCSWSPASRSSAAGSSGAGSASPWRVSARSRRCCRIPAYPFWSLAVFAVDLIIIYGLAVYGGRRRTA